MNTSQNDFYDKKMFNAREAGLVNLFTQYRLSMPLVSALIIFLGSSFSAWAANPFAGNWGGNFFVKSSGVVDLAEIGFGAFVSMIDNDGNLRFGVNAISEPIIGTVTNGAREWEVLMNHQTDFVGGQSSLSTTRC